MSKFLRTLLILLLIVAILGALFWYFFIRGSALPAALYESYAGFCARHGRAASAARFYAKASDRNPADLPLAIAASDAYAQCGNYTKAEYILVRAISYNPDVLDGYLALSALYVQQDKLLDAERLISACSSETVKSQLSALRPDAPVIQPDGGFSYEKSSVSLAYSEGSAYYSTTAEYPTTQSAPYTEPFTLDFGVTEVSAIVVGDNGLVSTLSTAEFTVCGEVAPVTFADEDFDAFVRDLLGKSKHADILSTELWEITDLTIPAELTDLSDLSYFLGLKSLTLQSSGAADLTVLSTLPALETLDLTGTAVSPDTMEAIGSLTTLRELYLGGCGVSSLDSLASLTKLQILDASDNQLTAIDALAAMPELQTLRLQSNEIASLAPLTTATALQILDISGNPAGSLGALSANTALTELYASECAISDISPLENKAALTTLDLSKNSITSIAALQSCAALTSIDAASNQISDLTPVLALPLLSNLDVSSNQITASPTFAENTPLLTLNLSFNQLTEVTGLSNLHALNYLNISSNRVADLSAITDLANLIQVDAYQNPIEDVSALEAHSIIVNYDPGYTLPEEAPAEESSEEAAEAPAA